jgi:hypothetical protein
MDEDIKKKYIKAMTIMALFNGAGGILFLGSFYLSKITAFLWAGLIVISFTALVLIWVLYKIKKA